MIQNLDTIIFNHQEGTAVQNVTLTVKDNQNVEIPSKGDEKLMNVTSVPGPPALFPIGERDNKSAKKVDTPNQIKLNWVYPFDNVNFVDTYLLKYCRVSTDIAEGELGIIKEFRGLLFSNCFVLSFFKGF